MLSLGLSLGIVRTKQGEQAEQCYRVHDRQLVGRAQPIACSHRGAPVSVWQSGSGCRSLWCRILVLSLMLRDGLVGEPR